MVKESIKEKYITIANICAYNIGEPQYIRQKLTDIRGEIENNTKKVRDYNNPLIPMDRYQNRKLIRKHKP